VPIYIRDEWQRLLFVNWVQSLVTDRLGLHGTQGSWDLLIDNAGRKVALDIKPPRYKVNWTSATQDGPVVDAIVDEAWGRTQTSDFGPGAWYKTKFISEVNLNSDLGQLHFRRSLSEHQRRRLHGPVRFTNDVLLEFEQKNLQPTPIAIPNFAVQATMRAAGPGPGPFTTRSGSELATLVRAVLAWATAAPIKHEFGGMTFPEDPKDVAPAQQLLADGSVGELTVDGIILSQRMGDFGQLGRQMRDPELLRRVHGSFYAYEQALLQEGEYVALVMLVSAVEALAVPNVRRWDKERPVARFVEFVKQATPEKLDEIMRSRDFKQVFGNKTSKTSFLQDLYARRSTPLHTGFMQHNVQGALGGFLDEGGTRVALVSELVRACINSFLHVPFSSLVGHPAVDPKA
jgi:hypothetical protein